MIISLSPVRMDEQLIVDREGDILWINGEECDLSPLTEGATLPASAISSKWFTGQLDRINGEIHLTLILPHGAYAPESTRFPKEIIMDYDGSVPLPIYNSSDIALSEALKGLQQ